MTTFKAFLFLTAVLLSLTACPSKKLEPASDEVAIAKVTAKVAAEVAAEVKAEVLAEAEAGKISKEDIPAEIQRRQQEELERPEKQQEITQRLALAKMSSILEGNDKRQKEKFIEERCIVNNFAQSQNDNLYGRVCLEGRELLIKTTTTGAFESPFTNFSQFEEDVDFLSASYKLQYSLLNNEELKTYSFLSHFLQGGDKSEVFYGKPDTEYRILFRIVNNYLILYKASKNPDNFPHKERMQGQGLAGLQKEGDYYISPFVGYPVDFCIAEVIRNNNNQNTNLFKRTCDGISLSNSDNVPYIKVNFNRKTTFDHLNKKDWFPIDYFMGEWYYVRGLIETSVGEIGNTAKAMLATFEKSKDHLNITDVSITKTKSNIQERQRKLIWQMPVKWEDFEWEMAGNKFEKFAERKYQPEVNSTNKPYVKVDFKSFSEGLVLLEKKSPSGETLEEVPIKLSHIDNLIVTNNFLTWTAHYVNNSKLKISFLKKEALDSKGFKPRRWFFEDFNKFFGVFVSIPEQTIGQGEDTSDDITKYFRMQKFNISLNTEEEKSSKAKVIKWYYSKNSTKDPHYRSLVEKAIKIYNKSFEYIMLEACPSDIKNKNPTDCPKIQVELVPDEPKDLGDIRYNIINLIWNKEEIDNVRGLLGRAPTSIDPNTGQIIGAIANIIINNHEDLMSEKIRNYIRYEIFQKDKKTPEEYAIHVVTPYLKEQIENHCHQVTDFITDLQSKTRQNTTLNDTQILLSCSQAVTKQNVFNIILHELGHNFGLTHNFICSMDPDNFYKNHAEMEQIFGESFIDKEQGLPKSSCVMDYLPLDQPQMNVLGKYDLAGLKFLYTNRAEVLIKEDSRSLTENTIELQLDEDPLKQTPLYKNDKIVSKYLRCTDEEAIKKSLMCDAFDYGSTPKEVVQETGFSFKRWLDSVRYRYDTHPEKFTTTLASDGITVLLNGFYNMFKYYGRWLQLKNQFLLSKDNPSYRLYQLNNETAVKTYTEELESHFNDTTNKEYKKYYPVKEAFKQVAMDFLFLKEMSCELQHNETNHKKWVLLEFLKNQTENINDLYVEDCYSPSIKDIATQNGYTVVDQEGIENFYSYYLNSEHPNYLSDVLDLTTMFFPINTNNQTRLLNPTLTPILFALSNEPDIVQQLKAKVRESLLKRQTFESLTNSSLIINFNRIIFNSIINSAKDNNDIRQSHIDDNTSYIYNLNSFYEKVQKPLEEGANFIPFLQDVFDSYSEKNRREILFVEFLHNRPEVVINQNMISFPHQSGSFKAKVLSNLKLAMKDLQEIIKKQEEGPLDLMDSYTKMNLEQEIQSLMMINVGKVPVPP